MTPTRKDQMILTGFDGSPIAELAAYFALDLASKFRAGLMLVFVVPPYIPEAVFPPVNTVEITERERKAAELVLSDMRAKLDGKGVVVDTQVLLGNPADEIARFAQNPEVGAVVVGKTGKGAIARVLLGSVTLSLARTCPKPLILVPPSV